MKIKRIFEGKEVEIELTHDELFAAFQCYEHHCDCEYVRNTLNSGCYEEFEDMTDKAWERAVSEIASKKREIQDDGLVDESVALDHAIEWYNKRYPRSNTDTDAGGNCDV